MNTQEWLDRIQPVNESTRRQKAVRAISGNNPHIRTIAILTSENPMGVEYPERLKDDETGRTMEFNRGRREDLEKYLALGCYAWFRIKGRYGSDETSYIIYNITLDDAQHIAEKYEQESFIFIRNNEDEISYQYWEQEGDGVFKMQHERKSYNDMTDADDLYSQISRGFKFQIPFFDGNDDNETEINEQFKSVEMLISSHTLNEAEITRRLNKSTDSKYAGTCRYRNRGMLYGEVRHV